MICDFNPSMEAHGGAAWLDDPGQQVLRFGNSDLCESFEAIEHLGLIQCSGGDLRIDGSTSVDLQIGAGLHGLPEAVIVKAVEPLFQFVLIVKNQHGASVPKPGHALQTLAGIARSPWPAEGTS